MKKANNKFILKSSALGDIFPYQERTHCSLFQVNPTRNVLLQ